MRIPSRGSDQFNLRFPDGMRDRIREAADANGRSMNAEIIHRLQTTIDAESSSDLPKVEVEGEIELGKASGILAVENGKAKTITFEELMKRLKAAQTNERPK